MFVHVNCAMSADGKIAGPDRKQVRISSDEDIARVKDLRKLYDSVLVGIGTVVSDDPHLTVKGLEYGDNPVRIVIDPNGRMPGDALVLNGMAQTIVVTSGACRKTWKNTEIIRSESMELADILNKLGKYGIESVLVEGGGETIASFFREGLVDRYTVFVGPLIIGGRTSPTPADGDGWIGGTGVKMKHISSEILGNGTLMTFEPI